MTLLVPTCPTLAPEAEPDPRAVVLIDQAAPDEPVLAAGVRAACKLGAPRRIVLLHPRLGLTTDSTVAAGFAARVREPEARLVRFAAHLDPDGPDQAQSPDQEEMSCSN